MRLFVKSALFAACAFFFASCDFGFDGDSFQNKAGAYFKEMTSTAAVAAYKIDADNVQTDRSGNICFGYEGDRTVTFTLRNPQHYSFLTNRNMTLGLAGNNGGAPMPLSETVTLVQDSSDTTKLVLTFPADFLKANPMGANISPVITMMHPVSLAPFTPYKGLKLSSNATPPMPNGAVVMQTTETPSRWVVCFNMPNSAIINEFHSDLESVSVNDSSAKVSVSGGIISLESGSDISASEPPGLVSNQNTGLSFSPNGQAIYYSTGDEADEKERVYTVTVTDNAGLVSSFGISTRGFKLSAPDAYLTDDASFANPFSINYSSAKNFVSQEDDGSSFIYLHGTAKTEAVNYTDSSGNAQSIPQYDYDPSNAQILYEIYLEDTFTTLVDSGMIKGLGGKIPIPAGTSYVRAYVRKPLYSDSEVITWWCRAVSTRFFVSEIGDDVMNTGSREKPYRTIQKAVNMFGEGIQQGDYDADCSCTIKVLGDELTPPDDFDFVNNGGAYINIPDPATVPTMPLASATVNIEGDGGTKTVNLKGRDAKILSASCGNVVLTDINLTGADFSSDSYNEALVEIASAASVRMNSVAISKNNLSVAATSAINIVKNSGTLRMNDSSVAENTRSIDGSTCVVLNCDGGETTLSNTSILNHHEDWTPAFIAASATFDMTGGEIKDNTESNYIIESGGLVTMTGVTVQNNGNLAASSGIHIVGNKMTLKDCVITKNKADCGAGIMVDGAELYLDSCSITENTAADDGAGVFCSSSATKISLKGKNTIYDNHTVSEPAKQNNIYLDDNATPPDLPTLKLTIESDISGSKIGLHYPPAFAPTLSASIPFTDGYGYGTKNKEKPGAWFTSDYNYGISDISSNEAAFVVSSGSMYGALDYTFDFELKAADGVTAASSMYFGKDASFVIAPTVARREQGATPASRDLYLNPADRKLYLDAGFTKKAAGDELVTLTAKLYSGGFKAEDLDITWETDKISLAVPASKATLADNYTIKVFRTFLGVDSSSSFAVACNHSAETAAAYIMSLTTPGTYDVEVEGVVGPGMDYSTDQITSGDDGLAKVAKAIKNAASDVMIILDARGTSYVPADGNPSDDDYNPYSEYNNNSYFAGCANLKEVYLPDWLQYIVTRSYGASHIGLFENCSGLTKVELSSNVKLLMYNAFKGCSSLARISLPAKISEASSLDDPRGIQMGAFVGCAEGFRIDFAGTKEQWGQVKRSNQNVAATKWHDGDREISGSTGHVTCGDGACGLDYKYFAGTPDITALDDASDLDFCSTVNVSNVAGFNLIAQWADSDATDFHNVTIVLQDDVTVEDNYWIKQFRGTFDGNNHTITQNYTTAYGGDAERTIQGETLYQTKRALFWSISTDAVIKNLTVEGTAQKAGLVGHMYGGSIEDCVVNVTVSGNSGDELGGFVSKISGPATIKNCVFKGSLANPYDNNGGEAGGIVGSVATNSVVIENCLNKGAICTTNEKVAFGGGIVGYCDYPIIIRNCKNTGNVRGKYAGGIIGHAQRVNVINCNNIGNITKMDTGSSGGIVGQTSPSNYDVVWPTLINNCNCGSAEGGIVGDFNCPNNDYASKPQPTNEYISHNYYYVATNPVGQVNSKYSWSSTSWGDSYFKKVTDDSADLTSTLVALGDWAHDNSDDSVTYARWTGTLWDVRLDLGDLEDK